MRLWRVCEDTFSGGCCTWKFQFHFPQKRDLADCYNGIITSMEKKNLTSGEIEIVFFYLHIIYIYIYIKLFRRCLTL